MAEWIIVGLTAASLIGGLIVFAIRSLVKPLQVTIENNTEALNMVRETLKQHDEAIADHSERIAVIETVHRVRGCDKEE